MADGRVIIDTRLNKKGLEHDVKSLTPVLKKLGGLLATAFSVKALINFGQEAVELASDIEEVQNVVDTAFGDMAYKMEEFADTAIKTYGISKLTAKRTGSTLMAIICNGLVYLNICQEIIGSKAESIPLFPLHF